MNQDGRTRQSVRFLLNGERIEIDGFDPDRTLLRYLREDLGLTGTKEGCAEGDCGACTVVVADTTSNDGGDRRLHARAINACIAFLPTLDGKAVFTVEGLANGTLHPAQRAMVECHGSQCGFCTPGIVMSLFALYKNNPSPGRQAIDDALAGNLCRCTGYEPIAKAAMAMYDDAVNTGDWRNVSADASLAGDEEARMTALDAIAPRSPVNIESGGRHFHSPDSIDELASLFLEHPDATLLAGGTDVGLWVTKELRQIDRLIWTGGVPDMLAIEETDDHTVIGAAVTLSQAMDIIVDRYPALEELFLRFASPPIRNAGTLGGNIANGSPIGDSMPALMVLGARLMLRKGAETRTLALDDFYPGYRQTALTEGEFLQAVHVPHPGDAGEYVASYKVSKRFDQDISAVCGAYRVRVIDGVVDDIRIAYGGMAAVPKRAIRAEAALKDMPWQAESLSAAIDALAEDFQPISDMRASDRYRQVVCGNLLHRFFLETTSNKPLSVYRYAR